MIGHTGGTDGSIFTVFTFPETQSAVVTMTNGRDFGDASDFTAQILTQALFDLKPSVDLIPWAKREAELRPSHHEIRLGRPWTGNRCPIALQRDTALYVGQYRGFGDRFTLTINTGCATCHEVFYVDAKIFVVFNDRKKSKCPSIFHKEDVYSFFDPDEKVWKMRQIPAHDYKQTLLKFQVEEGAHKACGLWWQWDTYAEPAWLDRIA
jgi:hypothetical protein